MLIEAAIIKTNVFPVQDPGAIRGSSILESFCPTSKWNTGHRTRAVFLEKQLPDRSLRPRVASVPQTYLYNKPPYITKNKAKQPLPAEPLILCNLTVFVPSFNIQIKANSKNKARPLLFSLTVLGVRFNVTQCCVLFVWGAGDMSRAKP